MSTVGPTAQEYAPSETERLAGGKFFVAVGLALTSDAMTEGSLTDVLDEALADLTIPGLDLLKESVEALVELVDAERTLRAEPEPSEVRR